MIFVAIDLHVPVSGTRTATGTRSLVVLWGTTNIFYPTIRTLLPVICVYLAFLGWLEKVGNEGFTIERLMYRSFYWYLKICQSDLISQRLTVRFA